MKILQKCCLLLFFPLSVYASEVDSALLRAERYYRQNDFSKAIAEYQTLADDGWKSAVLFYNLGNAYFKNHDIKSAILYYERAKRLAPNDESINENLKLSYRLIFDKVEAIPEHFLAVWGKSVRDKISLNRWSRWSIGCFVAMLALTLVFFFVRKMAVKKFAFWLAAFCLFFSITAFIFAFLQKANIERTDEAIVFTPSVTIKSSPDDSGNNLFILHEGIKVSIEYRIDQWYNIRIADGRKGWIRANDLKVI